MSRSTMTPAEVSRVTEKQFMQQVVDLAVLYGWLVYHTHDSRRSPAGFPDLILCKPGRHLIAAELKREGQKPTAAQTRWLNALALVPGVLAVWWQPHHFPSIVETLR